MGYRLIIILILLGYGSITRLSAQSFCLSGLDSSYSIPHSIISRLDSIRPTDSLLLQGILLDLLSDMQSKRFLEASVDSVHTDTTLSIVFIHSGPRYSPGAIISEHPFSSSAPDTVAITSPDSLESAIRDSRNLLLDDANSASYPFSSVTFVPVFQSDTTFDVCLELQKNKYFTIGGAHVVGNLNISDNYIERIIGLEKGKPYTPEYIKQIVKKIDQIGFATQYKSPLVVFAKDKAYLALFLNEKNADRFDLLIGLQPNTSTIPGVSNQFIITGNALIELVNKLGKGERILGEFTRPSAFRQQLRLEAEYPFLFRTPFSVNGNFKLFKSDSSFLETSFSIGAQYYFNYSNKLNIFWQRNTSDLKYIDTLQILNTHKLPATLDFNTNFYGLEFVFENLDFRFNPRKGLLLKFKASIGSRRININSAIANLRDPTEPMYRFSSLYDSIQLRKTIIKPEFRAELYIPAGKRFSIGLKSIADGLLGSDIYYNNEKFRIGGISNLRGFNEQSILSTMYAQITVEPKLILDKFSALYVFMDNAWINYGSNSFKDFRWYTGLGAGMNFGTKIGVFSLNLAVGKARGDSFDLRSAKIHFGYLSTF
jgi:outer membrane protein assembly factor BamA